MKAIRVLLVDDHPVVCQGYRSYLEGVTDIEVAAEAGTGAAAYRLITALRPDVIVFDLALPDVSGMELLRRICQRDPEARVLVFTMYENGLLMQRALQAGALGYLCKRHGPAVLVEAVRRVAAGEPFHDPHLATRRHKEPDALLQRLTPREFEVFQLLAEGRSVAEIARLLHLSRKTVGVHQTRILKKLNLANTVQLALLAVRCQVIQP